MECKTFCNPRTHAPDYTLWKTADKVIGGSVHNGPQHYTSVTLNSKSDSALTPHCPKEIWSKRLSIFCHQSTSTSFPSHNLHKHNNSYSEFLIKYLVYEILNLTVEPSFKRELFDLQVFPDLRFLPGTIVDIDWTLWRYSVITHNHGRKQLRLSFQGVFSSTRTTPPS